MRIINICVLVVSYGSHFICVSCMSNAEMIYPLTNQFPSVSTAEIIEALAVILVLSNLYAIGIENKKVG